MKILFLAGAETLNQSFPNLYHKFIENNHHVDVMTGMKEYVHNQMFEQNNIPVIMLESKKMLEYDIIISGMSMGEILGYNDVFFNVLNKDIPLIILQAFSGFGFSSIPASLTGSRISFCDGELFKNTQKKVKVHSEIMDIGNPKFDLQPHINHEKNLLYIDQHIFPVGKEGKAELSKLLIKIANSFPDYNLLVKPRFLQQELKETRYTHYCNEHLYDYIYQCSDGQLPTNLILLDNHYDLGELVSKANCVLTPYSTGGVYAVVLDKPILFLEGLPNEKHYEFYHLKDTYRHLRNSGCVINYKDILEYLPNGLKLNDEFRNTIYTFDNKDSSEKIIEVVEFFYKHIFSQNIYLPILELTYGDYQEKILKYLNCPNELLIEQSELNRYNFFQSILYNRLNSLLKEKVKMIFYSLEIHELNKIDLKVEKFIKKIIEKVDFNNLTKEIMNYYETIGDQFITGLVKVYYEENENLFYESSIFRIKLLESYLEEGVYEKVINFIDKTQEIEVYYFAGFAYKNLNDLESAKKVWNLYLKKVLESKYNYSPLYNESFLLEIIKELIPCIDEKEVNVFFENIPSNIFASIGRWCFNQDKLNYLLKLKKYHYLSPELLYYTGRIYKNLKENKKAIRYLEHYIDQCHRKYLLSALYHVGESYFELYDYKNALQYFRKCITTTTGNHERAVGYIQKIIDDTKLNER